MHKHYIEAQDLLRDSFLLAKDVLQSGYRPDHLLIILRGGALVGVSMHEYFVRQGLRIGYSTVRARSYTGIQERDEKVCLDDLAQAMPELHDAARILVVDDVLDTGNTLRTLLGELQRDPGVNDSATIRIAVPWYKPRCNTSGIVPDHHLNETEDWLVFPHELCGLEEAEIHDNKPWAAESLKP